MITNWATESVILFFLLSGIVINISQKRQNLSFFPFLKNRLLRIYPLFLVGFILAIITFLIIYKENLDFKVLSGNLLLLGSFQSYLVPVLKTNPVVWSLTYEMFFYFIFSLSILKYQRKFLHLWFVLSIICIPFYYMNFTGLLGHLIAMFAFSSIWLLGYYMYEYRSLFVKQDLLTVLFFTALLPGISRLHLSDNYYDVFKYFIFSIFSVPLFLFCINSKTNDNSPTININNFHKFIAFVLVAGLVVLCSNSLLLSKLIYLLLPFIFFVLSLMGEQPKFNFSFLKSPALFLGKVSYAVYIIHFPIILLVNYLIPVQFYYLSILVPSILVFALAWCLEKYFQPFVVHYFK